MYRAASAFNKLGLERDNPLYDDENDRVFKIGAEGALFPSVGKVIIREPTAGEYDIGGNNSNQKILTSIIGIEDVQSDAFHDEPTTKCDTFFPDFP
uniref:Uncharacterized protein n=1 Tax=Glossina palpalis gambiensis TaxID=67801 RepID=A0A1B0B227_9MUSC